MLETIKKRLGLGQDHKSLSAEPATATAAPEATEATEQKQFAFTPGEKLPIKGFWLEVKSVTPTELVLVPVGLSHKRAIAMGKIQKQVTKGRFKC